MDEKNKPEILHIKKDASNDYYYYYNREERLKMPGSPQSLRSHKKRKQITLNIVLLIIAAVTISFTIIVLLFKYL